MGSVKSIDLRQLLKGQKAIVKGQMWSSPEITHIVSIAVNGIASSFCNTISVKNRSEVVSPPMTS